MAKKRKIGGRTTDATGHKRLDVSDAKLRIKTYEDVADSEDEFFINRDKILVDEGPAQKRQRKQNEEDEFLQPSDEEVLADEGAYSSSIDSLQGDDDQGDEEQERDQRQHQKGSRSRGSSESDDASRKEDGGEEEWGTSKRDYYDADVLETEADALEEEQEAIRLQKKQLQDMTAADFGFDEADWQGTDMVEGQDGDSDQEGVVREILPPIRITDTMGVDEKRKILNTRYPEFELLAKEFLDLQAEHTESKTAVSTIQVGQGRTPNSEEWLPAATEASAQIPVALLKQSALTAYLGSLSMYFAIFTSGLRESSGGLTAKVPTDLRDHPIMETLKKCREVWERVKSLQSSQNAHAKDDPITAAKPTLSLQALVESNSNGIQKDVSKPKELVTKRNKRRKGKAQREAEAVLIEADAKRAERLQRTEDDLALLSTFMSNITRPSKTLSVTKTLEETQVDDDSDFGEETALTPLEAAEKAKRKKGLRFYTSQIAQKTNKRDNAGRDAGGDADIPYRERLKDRQARLTAEAEAKVKKKGGKGEPLGGESDEEDRRLAREVRDGHETDEYYDLVVARSKEKKASKAALAAAHLEAAREGGAVQVVEEIGADGKRAITYAIEKNKGLAPKRKKDVRNPRVKKRKKYEDKKKKLGSVRPVFKGGEGRGGYGGELTGIKKNLVRSIKF